VILLDRQKLSSLLINKETALYVLDEINSTNNFFNPVQNFATPSVCLAEKQSSARGRLGRKWYTPPYQNLSLSALYKFSGNTTGLNLVIGLAVRQGIESILGATPILQVKWPNDIMYSGQKLAGILIENQIIHNFNYVVAGIGINVNMEEDKDNINNSWTSLKKITGKEYDRNILAAQVINHIDQYSKTLAIHGLKYFINQWKENDFLIGHHVSITEHSATYSGKYLGLNQEGKLGLVLPDSTKKWFNYGDASIQSNLK
jgi:BirA family transcriptional regulator, biotin operon repressor / biotin---[acetyl-CoA-carboxylase] ligase